MLIGLTGAARSGKDTSADALVRELGFARLSFARPLKDGIKVMFGLTESHVDGDLKEKPLSWLDGVTPRQLMQTLGTEWGRDHVHRDVWLRIAQERYREIVREGAHPGVVITDVRFENEAAWVRKEGFLLGLVRIDATPVRAHSSEEQDFKADFNILNSGTVAEFQKRVVDLVLRWKGPYVDPYDIAV